VENLLIGGGFVFCAIVAPVLLLIYQTRRKGRHH
jgi:hypothetical protein